MAKKALLQTASSFAGPLSRRDLIKALAIAAAAGKTVAADPVSDKSAKIRGGRAARPAKKKVWIGHDTP